MCFKLQAGKTNQSTDKDGENHKKGEIDIGHQVDPDHSAQQSTHSDHVHADLPVKTDDQGDADQEC